MSGKTRHSLARRLAEQLRDVRAAVELLSDAVVLLDQGGHVIWFNQAAERLLGLHKHQDRGTTLATRLANSALSHWLRDGGGEAMTDVPAPGDPKVHLNVSLIPFGDEQSLLLARDISHVTRFEQVRRDFVANVSHELRTPLTVIHGYLELLEPDEVPELAPVLTEMRMQSHRMGQIVEDLLTLSKLEMQKDPGDERVAMQALLAILHKEAEALSKGRHKISVENSAHMDLLGSATYLHSAFSNLISNAVRYTPAGGKIEIRWDPTPTGAAYAVKDSGFGIPADHLARLTERFYRVSSSRSRETGGTGLGLSIVKHVLNLHQAELLIESEPGHGSTFTCSFDRARLVSPDAES